MAVYEWEGKVWKDLFGEAREWLFTLINNMRIIIDIFKLRWLILMAMYAYTDVNSLASFCDSSKQPHK